MNTSVKGRSIFEVGLIFSSIAFFSFILVFTVVLYTGFALFLGTLYNGNMTDPSVTTNTVRGQILEMRSTASRSTYSFVLPQGYVIESSDKISISIKRHTENCGYRCSKETYSFEGLYKNGNPIPYESYSMTRP